MRHASVAHIEPSTSRRLPDYLPARMINEFVYCPRLFHFEQVLGVFAENEHTIEGAAQHKRVDREGKSTPDPHDETNEPMIVTSITLSSEEHRVIAKLDLAEFDRGRATPVDYKHGRPRTAPGGLEAWDTDRVQLAVQAIVLRENGYTCDEGFIFYQKTRQRVRVGFDQEVMNEAHQAIEGAWEAAMATAMPPPLVDSPKCPGCSLVGVCLPDETIHYQERDQERSQQQYGLFDSVSESTSKPMGRETRLLVAPRSDLRPLYLNTQGLRVGKTGNVLRIKDRDKVVQEVRIKETCQVNVLGNVQISTQAIQELCKAEKPVCYFSQGGWFNGITTGLNTKNVVLRKSQVLLSDQEWFCLRIARALIAGKIRNQRTMMMRNHIEPPKVNLREMKRLAADAETARSPEELLGIEGYAARLYFSQFGGMLKREGSHRPNDDFRFDFKSRNRRPPLDPINALLSYGYSLLAKDLTVATYAIGLDPMIGYFHEPRHGRPALALDLMEPLRPLVVDSAVLSAINTGMITPGDFVRAGKAVAMTPKGRKAFLRAYEARMDSLVTHPQLEYRVSYRRLLEIQARLLAKMIDGELAEYPVFVTR
ncbi:MAG: CRISPR-associated endonuclease Cas1 [Bryobacterales bacterium]|nr:CRISPR-associated endonuclease Cas1 [Bryobacterales bacterium]